MALSGRSRMLSLRERKGGKTMADAARTHVGDLIEINRHRLGESGRLGEILEVLGAGEHEHYRVRWDDGRESIFTPGSDALIRRARRAQRKPVVHAGRARSSRRRKG
jgi:hypothetical protein